MAAVAAGKAEQRIDWFDRLSSRQMGLSRRLWQKLVSHYQQHAYLANIVPLPATETDPAFDRELGSDRVHFCTAGEAVRVLDLDTGLYRPSTIDDVYDLFRLADALEHIHHVGQPIVATEIGLRDAHDLSVAYAGMAGTRKSFGFSTATASVVDALVAMGDMVLGVDGGFRKRPFCVVGHCPIVSPLRFGKETSEVAVRCAELGLVSDMCVAPLAGATAPAALAGALVQSVAETLAGLVQVHLVRPGATMHFGNWVFVADLRTGAFSGGSGETALLMAAAAQMARFYGLPGSVAAGMTDSKLLDYQAGYEKGMSIALAGHAGGGLVMEAGGMMASLMGASFEGLVMDNDMIGAVQRTLKGIEVSDATLSYEVIEDVVLRGPQHFLGHPQTLQLMQSEYLYPSVANRMSLSEWEAADRPGLVATAHERARGILATHHPAYINPERDRAIRARFPIQLRPEAMRPSST